MSNTINFGTHHKKPKMKSLPLIVAVVLTLVGCTRNDAADKPPAANIVAAAAPAKPPPTQEEWKSALMSTYEETQVQDKGDGITKFMAKFHLPKEGPNSLAFGERDAFRKLRFYSMGMPMQIATGVKLYISLSDYDTPVLFMQPYYWGERWLFMNKISVLVDGEIAMEHTCEKTERDTQGVGVKEQCDFILNQQQIDALRKITDTSKVSVRLTGDKGYTNVERGSYNPLKDFVRDLQSGIAIYDKMNEALKDKIPPATKI